MMYSREGGYRERRKLEVIYNFILVREVLSYVVRRRWPKARPCAAVNLRTIHALTMATSASKGMPVL